MATPEQPRPTPPPSSVTPEGSAILFDFRQADAAQGWQVVNDGVMGGVSDSRIGWLADAGMVFTGTVRLENNGGFASVQTRFAPVDVSAYDSLTLDLRGDGQRYGVYLRDGRLGGVRFQADFGTEAGRWQSIRLPFSAFEARWLGSPVEASPLNLTRLSGAAFIISDKQAGPFALEISAIRVTLGP